MNRRSIAGVSLWLAAVCAAAPAAAQSRNVSVSVSSRYDSNLFRVPAAVRDALPNHGQEIVTYVVVEGGVKTRIGVVALTAQGGFGQRFHANNPHFNAFNYGGDTSAIYQTGSTDIEASAAYSHEPVSFDETTSTRKILHSLLDTRLSASHDLLGYFRLVGRAGYLRNSITGGVFTTNGVDEYSYGGGIGYFSPSGNSVTLEYSHRISRGLRAKLISVGEDLLSYKSDYTEDSLLSQIDYQITGLTSVRGSIGYTKHDDRSIFDADVEGLNADIALKWSPLPGLVISPAFRRGFSSESRLFSNGIRVTSYSLSANEKLFGRLNLSVKLSRENRRFRYDVRANDPLLLGRRETTTHAGAGLSYSTGLKFDIGLDYEHISRTSTQGDFPFAADTVMLSVSRGFNP